MEPGEGFTLVDLKKAKEYVEKEYKCKAKIHYLNRKGLVSDSGKKLLLTNKDSIIKPNNAYFLIIKGYLDAILTKNGYTRKDLMEEIISEKWDDKYYDTRRKKVLNKQARKNNVVAGFNQDADYENRKGTVHSFSKMPIMKLIRKEFGKLGTKFTKFACAEGNLYEDGGEKNNGIGWHGDTERRRVLAMRIGIPRKSMPFYYHWFHKSKKIGKLMKFPIDNGDVMIMSEHAVGTDWRSSNKVTLRHSTGADKYTYI